MILVDSSVWIDYFAARPTIQVGTLDSYLADKEDVCICGVILTEVLQGIKYQHEYKKIRNLFDHLPFMPMDREIFLRAADIYRFLRQRGLTIRRPVDCMIAAVALENDIPILHNDRDFQIIARHFHLKSPPPLAAGEA
jgi:predicted nucleic acid-binding protein